MKKRPKISVARKKLLALQKKGFLFHGSPFKIDKLGLRQPVNFNIKKNKYVKHGKPCVAATPFADIAIFRAIINKTNFPSKSKDYAASFGIKSKKLNLATTKKVLENLSNQCGYVYVFDKKQINLVTQSRGPYYKIEPYVEQKNATDYSKEFDQVLLIEIPEDNYGKGCYDINFNDVSNAVKIEILK